MCIGNDDGKRSKEYLQMLQRQAHDTARVQTLRQVVTAEYVVDEAARQKVEGDK